MAIVSMTAEEIRKKYPITPERAEAMHRYYLSHIEEIEANDDPDCPAATDEMLARACQPACKTTAKNPAKVQFTLTLDLEPALASMFSNLDSDRQQHLNTQVEHFLRQVAV